MRKHIIIMYNKLLSKRIVFNYKKYYDMYMYVFLILYLLLY